MEWINGRGSFNQGIQGTEVYVEASNNKEPKSAEESNFSGKKGKERPVMSKRPQGNHIHKSVDQKYDSKKKSNNTRYEGKENQNCNITVTNEVTNNSILKEILQRLDNIERRHIGAIAPNRS